MNISFNKKWIIGIFASLIVIVCIFVGINFFNSSKSDNYITNVKAITFENGQTMEQYVNDNIIAGEMYQANKSNFLFNKGVLFLLKYAGKDEALYLFKQSGLIVPDNISNISWKLDGKTQTGNVIIASNEKIKIKFEITENGDYLEINPNKINIYSISSQSLLPKEKLKEALVLYNTAIKYGYENSSVDSIKTQQRFDEKKILDNFNDNYEVSYFFRGGRVKKLTDNSTITLELENRSYLPDITKELAFLDSELTNYTPSKRNKVINLANKIEYLIIAEKLRENIETGDREKIKKLEIKANNIFNKMELTIRGN